MTFVVLGTEEELNCPKLPYAKFCTVQSVTYRETTFEIDFSIPQ